MKWIIVTKENLSTLKNTHGLYLMFDSNNKCIYIGQSFNLQDRIGQQNCIIKPKIIKARILPNVTRQRLRFLEYKWIRRLMPSINISGKVRSKVYERTESYKAHLRNVAYMEKFNARYNNDPEFRLEMEEAWKQIAGMFKDSYSESLPNVK